MEAKTKVEKKQFHLSLGNNQQLAIVFLGLVALIVVFGMISSEFLSMRNITNLLRQIAPILIIGIGQGLVLITGNIDLSIGSVVGMSGMIVATLMTHGFNVWLAVALTLVACLGIGVLNGVLVAVFKIPPFIATLGTMTACRGIAQIANNNYNTDAIPASAQGFRSLFYYGQIGPIYAPVIIALVIFLAFNFWLTKTRGGKYIYAIGSNSEASRLSGVNVSRSVITVYVMSAFCAFIVGLSATATSGVGTMDAGNMYEMYAVAAATIGGISTLGGQGLLAGAIVGAGIWGVLQNGLQFAGAPVAIRNIVIGIIVILSVSMDIIFRKKREARG